MKPDAPPATTPQTARSPALSNREPSNPPSPAGPPAPPASRPKLNLAKRTVSENVADAATAPPSDSKSSPFGAAKPIDTATREKEVEEKRQIAIREKKEADDKAKADKKIADDKAKEERRLAKETEDANKPSQPVQSPKERQNSQKADKQDKRDKNEKENGVSAPTPGKQYEILRRHANDDASAADEEAEEAEEAEQVDLLNGDKDVKPRVIVRDPASTNGNTAEVSTETTAGVLEEEGWSTIPEKKKRKNGNAASRALAS